jgi:CRISPR-associated protein Cas2
VRERVAKVLLSYGNRVQQSVFEVLVRSPTELERLCAQLRAVADDSADIRLYRLCEHCQRESKDFVGEKIIALPAVIIV